MQLPQAFIFDMDGVILDSEPVHLKAIQDVFVAFGHALDIEDMHGVVGCSDQEAFEALWHFLPEETRQIEVLLAHKQSQFEAQRHTIKLIDGFLPFIQAIRPRLQHIGLATSSVPEDQAWAFEAFDLHPLFDVVVTAGDVTYTKPHPEPYLLAARQLGVAPAGCWVIEDSRNGIRAAKAARCTAIGLTTTFPASALREAGADHVVTSYSEIHRLFGL